MAAVAGNSTRLTADKGDGDEGKEHSNRESEKTLHHIPPIKGNLTRHAFLKPSRNTPDPGRPPDRSKTSGQPKNPRAGTIRTTGSTPLQALTVGERFPPGESGQLG
jgi:hypothetical protein